jgi:hypothetical protein
MFTIETPLYSYRTWHLKWKLFDFMTALVFIEGEQWVLDQSIYAFIECKVQKEQYTGSPLNKTF